MAYAILRLKKLKQNQLTAAWKHGENREKIPHLSHPERTKENMLITTQERFKGKGLTERANMRIADFYQRAVRKDAVKAVEVVLSFSPEAALWIDTDERRMEWITANLRFLADKFKKENILAARVDFDESTMHMHAFICPEKDGRLSAKMVLGNKYDLSKLQSDYADAMSVFGLSRGVNTIDHPEQKQYNVPIRKYWAQQRDMERANENAVIGG